VKVEGEGSIVSDYVPYKQETK